MKLIQTLTLSLATFAAAQAANVKCESITFRSGADSYALQLNDLKATTADDGHLFQIVLTNQSRPQEEVVVRQVALKTFHRHGEHGMDLGLGGYKGQLQATDTNGNTVEQGNFRTDFSPTGDSVKLDLEQNDSLEFSASAIWFQCQNLPGALPWNNQF